MYVDFMIFFNLWSRGQRWPNKEVQTYTTKYPVARDARLKLQLQISHASSSSCIHASQSFFRSPSLTQAQCYLPALEAMK